MTSNQALPCPLCQTQIPFDTSLLLQGQKFSCPNPDCDAVVGIEPNSVPVAEEAMKKFDDLKQELNNKK